MDFGIGRDVGPCEMQPTHLVVGERAVLLDPEPEIVGIVSVNGLGVVVDACVFAEGVYFVVDDDTIETIDFDFRLGPDNMLWFG